MAHILITDGGSKKYTGYGSYAILEGDINELSKAVEVRYFTFPLGPATNNVAEYRAMILGLEALLEMEPAPTWVLSDSALLINQVTGKWKVKAKHIAPLRGHVVGLLCELEQVTLSWVPRELIVHYLGH